jgi:hypothetical protein
MAHRQRKKDRQIRKNDTQTEKERQTKKKEWHTDRERKSDKSLIFEKAYKQER